MTTNNLLTIHCIIIGVILFVSAYVLNRRSLFLWTSTGFWAWIAFLLYFFLYPLAVLIQGDLFDVNISLKASGGVSRGIWILFVASIGIIIYFYTYLYAKPSSFTFYLKPKYQPITLFILITLLVFISVGLYSLLTYRASLIGDVSGVIIEQGRFVGNVTGYEFIAYQFLFVPTFFLLMSNSRSKRLAGLFLGSLFFVLSIPHAWSRYLTVSLLIAISIADAINRKKNWPKWFYIITIIVLSAVYQVRSHTTWTLSNSVENFISITEEIPQRGVGIVSGNDTAMLKTWYVESYLKDTLTGFDYGLPLVNYLITGWVPNRIFPQKYFIIDSLNAITNKSYPRYIDDMLFGGKSTLLGSFYSHGWLIGVVLGAILLGFLSRKMDGMVRESSPQLIKAVGISWISLLWMIWGSADYWAITVMGSVAIPAIVLWLVSPKYRPRHSINTVVPTNRNTLPYM